MTLTIARSGINTALATLKTAANNIANAATTGFKSSRVETGDLPGGGSIGSGVRVTAVNRQFTQGTIQFSDDPLNLAINGRGFFMLQDNGTTVYSRNGAFRMDQNGYLVNDQNQRLQGFMRDRNGQLAATPGDLRLDTAPGTPAATTRIDLAVNLSADAPVPAQAFDPTNPDSYSSMAQMTVFDSTGREHQLGFFFSKTTNPNQVELRTRLNDQDLPGTTVLQFTTSGTLSSPTNVAIAAGIDGAAPLNITLALNGSTQYGGPFQVNALNQDGRAPGRFDGLSIGSNGILTARYTNGQTEDIAQIALADFANPQGLRNLGSGSFTESNDSGTARLGTAGSGSLGLLESGAVENANTNMAEQLLALKTAGYQIQANAKVIIAADKMLGTLFDETA